MSESPPISFTGGEDGGRLLGWCRHLGLHFVESDGEEDEEDRRYIDRGARARLKRCRMPGDALLEPAFQDLLARLLPDKAERADAVRDRRLIAGLARVAVLLPHMRKVDQRKRLSVQLAEALPLLRSPSGLRSPLRVQGLIREDDPDEAVARWRRLLPLLSSGVNACDLARLVLHWSDEGRRDFAFHYFSTASLNAIDAA